MHRKRWRGLLTQVLFPGMRVVLLADTHGALDKRIGEVVRECGCAVHAGDIGGANMLAALHPTGTARTIRSPATT